MRSVFTIIFILAISAWLHYELKMRLSLLRYWKWLVAAVFFQIIAQIISSNANSAFIGNVLLHAIGGGVVSACLFFYMVRTFNVTCNWRLQIVMLFTFVSTLGVLNELYEYAFELMHMGQYSYDTHDTWRDFVANTSAAFIAWLAIRLSSIIFKVRAVKKRT